MTAARSRPVGRRFTQVRRTGARRTGRGRLRVLVALLGLGVLAVVGVATPAAAHNVLLSTAPTDGTTVTVTPAAVVLTFDQPAVAMGTQVIVTGPAGPVQLGAARLVDTTVSQALQGGAPAGNYTVAWRVTSADGHPVSGTFAFTSREAGTGTPTPTESPVPVVPAAGPPLVTRAVLVVGFGLLVFSAVAVVLPRVRRRRRG